MNTRKSIFITGAASGIGRETARHFAAKGWFIGLADINETGLAETAAMLPADQFSTHLLDVRDRAAWQTALADFWEKAGHRLDVLFNNAGIGRGGPFAEMTPKDVDATLDINISGVVRGAEAGFPYLKETPGACLLNTASAAGIMGNPNMAIYCATKFAVRGFTESLDQEWEEHAIKVRSLMPAFIDTPILDGALSGSNRNTRQLVRDMGLEISPVSMVAEAAWNAVHGDAVHVRVGKSAHRLWHMVRLFPGFMRQQAKKRAASIRSSLTD
jgi:NAD(P)-dependent dehydrogenase (short-subunit alcohol dehydrogenase family)